MSTRAITVCLAVALPGAQAAAVEPPSPTPGSLTDQRLVFSTDGSTLTGGSGGAGGSATWVGDITPQVVIGAGAEYQQIANAHWTTGNFSGALALGGEQRKTHLYIEAHEGAGDVGDHAFHYSLASLGLLGQLTPELTLQLEERYIDVDKSYGSLPKLGLTYRATLRLSASVSYAKSFGGNLGTRLVTGRIDYSGTRFNAIAGLAGGPAAPAVIFSGPGVNFVKPGPQLREGFVGIGKPLQRTDWLLLGDYQDVGGIRRSSVTLACTVHLRAHGQPQ